MTAFNIKIKSVKALEGLPRYVYVLAVIAALGMSSRVISSICWAWVHHQLSTVFPWGLWISFDLTNVAFSGAAFTSGNVGVYFPHARVASCCSSHRVVRLSWLQLCVGHPVFRPWTLGPLLALPGLSKPVICPL